MTITKATQLAAATAMAALVPAEHLAAMYSALELYWERYGVDTTHEALELVSKAQQIKREVFGNGSERT